jgi:hypothetical protein
MRSRLWLAQSSRALRQEKEPGDTGSFQWKDDYPHEGIPAGATAAAFVPLAFGGADVRAARGCLSSS